MGWTWKLWCADAQLCLCNKMGPCQALSGNFWQSWGNFKQFWAISGQNRRFQSAKKTWEKSVLIDRQMREMRNIDHRHPERKKNNLQRENLAPSTPYGRHGHAGQLAKPYVASHFQEEGHYGGGRHSHFQETAQDLTRKKSLPPRIFKGYFEQRCCQEQQKKMLTICVPT